MTRRWDGFTDVELVALLSGGDLQAAACLYDRYASILLALSFRILRERAEAEDVVHDAFVTMANRAAQYTPERGSVIAWLVTLVRNLSIDRTRRRDRRGVILRSAVVKEPKGLESNPEELLADARTRAKVRRALATIPEVQRATLEFAFFEIGNYGVDFQPALGGAGLQNFSREMPISAGKSGAFGCPPGFYFA